jgi:hypothetical protein
MLAVLGFTGRFAAAAIQDFETPVNTGPQAPGVWYTDRYAPNGFSGQAMAPDGRTGTLQESIRETDSSANRTGFGSAFYNTQGRKFDLDANSDGAFIDLYVDGAWDALDQSENPGRLASFWASGDSGTFPIIEFSNDTDGGSTNGFRVWDSFTGIWTNVAGFTDYDKWYQIGFTVDGSAEKFYVNGTLVQTIADSLTTSFDNVILQGYNSGNDYDIYWDNGNFGPGAAPVPEPATLAIWSGIGIAGLVAGYRRKRLQLV